MLVQLLQEEVLFGQYLSCVVSESHIVGLTFASDIQW